MTNETPVRWFPFELREESDFKDEPVLSCYLAKVFHFWQGRNAYWGTWSSTYPGHESFSFDLAGTKAKVARRRVQGSKWTIEELPVIVLAGEEDCLIVGEINTERPLAALLRSRKRLLTLEQYGHHFLPRRANSIFRILARRDLVSPARVPFWKYRSVSYGGNYALSWTKSVADQDFDYVLRLIARVNKGLHREGCRTSR